MPRGRPRSTQQLVQGMHARGWTYRQIGEAVRRSESYVRKIARQGGGEDMLARPLRTLDRRKVPAKGERPAAIETRHRLTREGVRVRVRRPERSVRFDDRKSGVRGRGKTCRILNVDPRRRADQARVAKRLFDAANRHPGATFSARVLFGNVRLGSRLTTDAWRWIGAPVDGRGITALEAFDALLAHNGDLAAMLADLAEQYSQETGYDAVAVEFSDASQATIWIDWTGA